MKKVYFLAFLFFSCGPEEKVKYNYQLNSVLWMQASVEYEAVTYQIFKIAEYRLDEALADTNWVAVFPKKTGMGKKKPAIIVDIDETILNNSPYRAGLLQTNLKKSEQTYLSWVNQVRARAIKGSIRFLRLARDKGVTIFYVTNRHELVKETTRLNLRNLGFPLEIDFETILTPKEKDFNKNLRRRLIAKHYRVIMIFGDDLIDFSDIFDGRYVEDRRTLVKDNRALFGKKWFILPNPIYGSWDNALYFYDENISEIEKHERRIEYLEF
jgi:acid phosphatase